MMRCFDSHAHYNDKKFDQLPGGAEALLTKLFSENVSGIVNIGTNPDTNRQVLSQAERYQQMFAAVGIHPEDCHYLGDDPQPYLEEIASLIETDRQGAQKIVAIGEIGLDYHYEWYGTIPMDKEKQKDFLRRQLELARRLRLPVIIHDREAHGDIWEIVRQYPEVKGVFHSFSGSRELAKDLVRIGWYVSFSGSVTFTNAEKVRLAAAAVPKDRLLIETDCPYLAPHPFRGQLNHSGLLSYTCETLAQVHGTTPREMAELTAENAKEFFALQGRI